MRFQDLFRGYTGSHGISVPTEEYDSRGKKKHLHKTVKGEPTETEWSKHLSGQGPGLGIIPLLDDNRNTFWGVIDIDKYNGTIDHASLERDCAGLPLVMTLSKSRGAHLWLFCKEPTPAKLVMDRLTEWASALGFGGSEVFPKQHTRLVGKDDQGNWINLPYFGDTRKCFVGGEEVGLDKFLETVQSRLVTKEILNKLQIDAEKKTEWFADGPPCLQTIFAQGISEGGRNNTLFNVGVYYKKKNPENWQELFHQFNRENIDPPLEDKEVRDSERTLERKLYNFTCNKHPMDSHCNRGLCIKREFGVANGSENTELNVILTGLTKIDTTTPRWFINIDGVRAEIPDTNVLMDQKKFSILVVEKVHKVMTPMKGPKWHEEVQKLLNGVEVVEAPAEASPEGLFVSHLHNFVDRRKQSQSRDMLLQGRVWVCEACKRAYFRPQDLEKYLKQEGFRELNTTQRYAILNDLRVQKGRFNIKGAHTSFYSIATPELQAEPFDVPEFEVKEKTNGSTSGSTADDYGSAF